jgi:peptidoglycan/xylan/chitin deacetylase (PgdA/CDA1 family)
MAHANLVVDQPERTGFDWDLPFGAKVIGETFASIPSLSLVKELWTPLYRIQLFRRENGAGHSTPSDITEVIKCEERIELLPEVARQVLWNGGTPWRQDCKEVFLTDRLPILMYHRVAPDGPSEMKRYRVTPDVFEEQLCYLRDAGYYSVRLEDWHAAMETKRPIPGRAVIITFDDGYSDFLTYAWPLLKRYGFSASVFLVAGEIGGVNSWDLVFGERVPLLDWKEIALLQEEGVEFGSHSMTHRPLTALSPEEIVREGARSKAILERNLSMRIQTFAYPYGASDRVVEHLIGACGFIYGFSCRPELSAFHDALLALPRIEIIGTETFQQFLMKLSPQ